MSTAGPTSLRPRGRRDAAGSEMQSSKRSSSHASQRLSKTTSRQLDETLGTRSRPESPLLFWQRTKAVDLSRASDPILGSLDMPRASIRSQQDKNALPTPLRSRRSAENARVSKEAAGVDIDHWKSWIPRYPVSVAKEDIHAHDRESRWHPPRSKSSNLSKAATAKMQPKVYDAPEEDTRSETAVKGAGNMTIPDIHSTEGSNAEEQKPMPVDSSPATPNFGEPSSPDQPRQTYTPVISPPQSPRLYYESPQPDPYHYMYPLLANSMPDFPSSFYPIHHQPPPPTSSPGQAPSQEMAPFSTAPHVVPNINGLPEYYQVTQGQLWVHNVGVKQIEEQQREEITRLRLELDAKKEAFERIIESLIAENHKYKSEIEEKDGLIVALEESVSQHEAERMEFESFKARCAEAIAATDATRLTTEGLMNEKLGLEKELEKQKEKHQAYIEEVKTEHNSILEAKERDDQKASAEYKQVVWKVQMELASLITKHSQQNKDLEACRGEVGMLEGRLASREKEHDEEVASLRHELESQLATVASQWQEEVQSLQESHDRKLKDLAVGHEPEVAKAVTEHERQMAEVRGELELQKTAFEKLQREQFDLVGVVASWKVRHQEWLAEKDRLYKVLGTLGHASDKSQTNECYTEGFLHLAHTVEMIADECSRKPPRSLPVVPYLELEPGVPDVFGSTRAACELRALVIQHRIFRVLHSLIFQRYVFASFDGCADADLDRILSGLSALIGQKSVRREALWRSIVLRALHTNAQGKATASAVASTAFREIVEQTQDLTDIGNSGALADTLKQVVRTAVEIWRQARVETDPIASLMPEAVLNHVGSQVILWIRPRVTREQIGKIVDWGRDNDPALGQVQVLLEGMSLRKDSPVVRERQQELAQRMKI
ncbi:hypothetical protein DV736_g2447, partial [Chaetothyriales sp. CBS 134916]